MVNMAKEVRHDKSCRFRLYPNKEQREWIAKTFGCCRWVYNWGLAMRKKTWEEEKKSLSLTDIQSRLPAMKKDAATSWLKEVDAKVLIFSLRCMICLKCKKVSNAYLVERLRGKSRLAPLIVILLVNTMLVLM